MDKAGSAPDAASIAAMVATMTGILPPESSSEEIHALLEDAGYDMERAMNAYFNPKPPVQSQTQVQSLPLKLNQALPVKRPSFGGGSSASKRARTVPLQPTAAVAQTPQSARQQNRPLAERVRPTTLDQLVGQKAFAPDSPLGRLVQSDRLPSVILWGPPGASAVVMQDMIRLGVCARAWRVCVLWGTSIVLSVMQLLAMISMTSSAGCGKTTLATILAKRTKHKFCKLSAVEAGVKDAR